MPSCLVVRDEDGRWKQKWALPLAITPASIAIPGRTAISRLDDDVLLVVAVIHTVVALGIAPPGWTFASSLGQNLFGLVAIGSTVLALRIRIARRAFIA